MYQKENTRLLFLKQSMLLPFPTLWTFALVILVPASLALSSSLPSSLSGSSSSSSPIPPLPPISLPVWSLACSVPKRIIQNEQVDTTTMTTTDTSMNIMTYCTAISISPKLWVLALYPNTLTKDSFLMEDNDNDDEKINNQSHGGQDKRKRKRGILQLLTPDQASLVPILGKQSGYQTNVNKEEQCQKAGWPWYRHHSTSTETSTSTSTTAAKNLKQICDHAIIPGCALYVQLEVGSILLQSEDEVDNIADDGGGILPSAGDHVLVLCRVVQTGHWNQEIGQLEWTALPSSGEEAVEKNGNGKTSKDDDGGKITLPRPPVTPLDPSTVLYTGYLRQEGIL